MSLNLADEIPLQSIEAGASATTWREAVTVAGDLLVAGGVTTPAYTEEMIQTVEKLGPYIVLAPGIAIAHSRPSPAVLRTGLSLATLEDPVEFGSKKNDPVRLVVGLAALDHDSHLEVMKALAKLLSNRSLVDQVIEAKTAEEIRDILAAS